MDPCATHPEVAALGVCIACERPGCTSCLRQLDGNFKCIGHCPADPLAGASVPPASLATDKSDVILPSWLSEEEKSNTSILEMAPLKPSDVPPSEDPPGVRGNSTALDTPSADPEPSRPSDEDPLPILLVPGTRRATIDHFCFRHADTPAVVICSRCSRPICSICGADSPEGFVCSSYCTLQPRRRPGLLVASCAFVLAVVFIVVALVRGYGKSGPPVNTGTIIAQAPAIEPKESEVATVKVSAANPERPTADPTPEPPKAEPKLEPKPEPPKAEPPKVEPKPEPPKPEPKVEPKPEPPKSDLPKPEPPKPVVVVVDPKPEPPPKPSPLARAAGLIREATPILGDVAEVMDDAVLRRMDRGELLARLDTVRRNLQQARAIYADKQDASLDPALLMRRIERIDRTLEAVPVAQERIHFIDELEKAALRIREAKSLLGDVAGVMDEAALRHTDPGEILRKLDTVQKNLEESRSIYQELRKSAPDPSLLDRRIERIDRVLEAVPVARERARVTEALERAALRVREATTLGQAVMEGIASPPEEEIERQELRVKRVLMKEKLHEARALYESVRDRAPDPDLIDARMGKIEGILRMFEGR
jgi:hypothetical protein